MKLNELIKQFTIAMNNEEAKLLKSLKGVIPESFDEREHPIQKVLYKSLVSKVYNNGDILVVKMKKPTSELKVLIEQGLKKSNHVKGNSVLLAIW